jgi:hypothetical protein
MDQGNSYTKLPVRDFCPRNFPPGKCNVQEVIRFIRACSAGSKVNSHSVIEDSASRSGNLERETCSARRLACGVQAPSRCLKFGHFLRDLIPHLAQFRFLRSALELIHGVCPSGPRLRQIRQAGQSSIINLELIE